MSLRASATLRLTANEPLVAPARVAAGSWPGNDGKLGGRESKIVPNSVSVVVGGATLARTTGLARPPGTGVRTGAERAGLPAGLGVVVVDPQPATRIARITARIRTSDTAAERRSAITGSS